jgi:O-antigen/teichoic acid export membrane protein
LPFLPRQFLKHPEARAAAKNLGWLAADWGLRLVFSVLVGLWVARFLGPARLGTLSYSIALTALIGVVPAFGLDTLIKREILRSPADTAGLLASAFVLRLGAGVVSYAALGLAATCTSWGAGEESRLLGVLGLVLFQPALFLPNLWLQAQLRAKWILVVQVSALGVASAGRLWLIFHQGSLPAFAWVVVGEMILSTAGFFFAARWAGLRFPLTAARRATIRRLISEAWPLMFASLAIVVYFRIDEVMLRHLAGSAAVGIYAAAARASEMWYFIPTALASSLLPALVRARAGDAEGYQAKLQAYYDVSAAAAYALSLPIALAAPWLVRLAYGAAFAPAGPILSIHIWSSVFVFLGAARGQWLINEGLQRFYLVATGCGAVANVLLNFVLIPRWGGPGAAYATVVSYALATWIASYFHPAVRPTAAMQTRALLIPFRALRHLRRA